LIAGLVYSPAHILARGDQLASGALGEPIGSDAIEG
jgi:hypothetical protein